MSNEINNEIKLVSEAEREAVEAALAAKFENAPKFSGAAGNSPYSSQTVVFCNTAEASKRGARVSLASVCRSHNGAGHYKGRGRQRTVTICAEKPDGDLAVCVPSDRDAEQVGFSGFYVRPWTTHEAEQASRGLGLAADAMAEALAKLGL